MLSRKIKTNLLAKKQSYEIIIGQALFSEIRDYLRLQKNVSKFVIISDTKVQRLYGQVLLQKLQKAGLNIAARSTVEKLAEIIELPKKQHPFYIGTQGHPEYKSRPLNPHPLFIAFIEAAKKHSK